MFYAFVDYLGDLGMQTNTLKELKQRNRLWKGHSYIGEHCLFIMPSELNPKAVLFFVNKNDLPHLVIMLRRCGPSSAHTKHVVDVCVTLRSVSRRPEELP